MERLRKDQKVALITGGGGGLGKATALRLAQAGFDLVINYRNSREEVREVEQQLKRHGTRYLLIKADISKENQVKKMLQVVRQKFSSLDVLVNNAGIIDAEPLSQLTMRGFDHIIDTNLRGSILVTKESLPLLKKSTAAKIIFIVSSSAFLGSSTQFSYAVSKAGILGAIRALALEVAPSKILVNGVAPGYINTPMALTGNSQMKKSLKKIPLGRICEPEEVAELVAFLASPANTYITGQCIHINGGRYFG